jgi:peptidoglycan/xylan/chitin deacetylase (PgdA/CDA1 family)
MSRILAIHGVVPGVDPSRIDHKNMSDLDLVRRFFASIPPLVSLRDAIAGKGDALTVDDATRAAADAALLAREYGHAVTLFVNPDVVESGAPYWFTLLDLLLAKLRRPAYDLNGVRVPAATLSERLELRRKILLMGRAMAWETDRVALVLSLVDQWQTAEIEVPPALSTLRKQDLVALRDAGVEIGNHGWSHTDHAHLSPRESAEQIRQGQAWLRKELGVDAPYFAVPFGNVMPSAEARAACTAWLTMYWRWPEGPLADGVLNRVDPLPQPPVPPADQPSRPPSRARALMQRLTRYIRKR